MAGNFTALCNENEEAPLVVIAGRETFVISLLTRIGYGGQFCCDAHRGALNVLPLTARHPVSCPSMCGEDQMACVATAAQVKHDNIPAPIRCRYCEALFIVLGSRFLAASAVRVSPRSTRAAQAAIRIAPRCDQDRAKKCLRVHSRPARAAYGFSLGFAASSPSKSVVGLGLN